MSVSETITAICGALAVIATFFEVSKIQINPWSALAKMIGNALNRDVLTKLDGVSNDLQTTNERLDEHIRVDDERDADTHRQRILRFNSDLMGGKNFTHEYFVDMLAEIDEYERYCNEHPIYRNNRAVMAIAHIKQVCEEHERNNSFLK